MTRAENPADPVEAKLLLAWNLELYDWWNHYNQEYLDGVLSRPEIRLVPSHHTLGSWDRRPRAITISADHVRRDAWTEVMATLRHEMAHQFVEEVERRREPPHGPAFRAACDRLRVSSRAARSVDCHGPHGASDAPARGRLLERVAKLMSLGSSPNRHEAEAALRKARALLVKHNVYLVETRAERTFAVTELGPVKQRHQAWEYSLSSLLNEFFFVETIWARGFDAPRGRRGTVLQVYGTEANLEMAGYVHDYLTRVLEESWSTYRDSQRLGGNRERMRFYEGVLVGLVEKLRRQDADLAHREGLILVGDSALATFFRHHNPRVRTSTVGGGALSAAYEDGRRRGRRVTIHKPVAGDGSGFGGYLSR